MKIKSINNIIREQINKYFDKEYRLGHDESEIADNLVNYIYSLEPITSEDFKSETEINRLYYIKIIYLDALKMAIYKHNVGLVDDTELIFYNNLTGIQSENELLAEVSADPSLLKRMILECYKFTDMNDLSRTLVVKSLAEDENEFLCRTYKLHICDILMYGKKIKVSDIVEYLNSYITHQVKCLSIDFVNNNIALLTGFVSNLVRLDGSDALDLLLEIGKIDYSVCKYIAKKTEPNVIMVDHIDYYENYDLEEILYRLSSDKIFLKDALWNFYSLYFDKEYEDIQLSEEILKSEDSDKMSKKLIIK